MPFHTSIAKTGGRIRLLTSLSIASVFALVSLQPVNQRQASYPWHIDFEKRLLVFSNFVEPHVAHIRTEQLAGMGYIRHEVVQPVYKLA